VGRNVFVVLVVCVGCGGGRGDEPVAALEDGPHYPSLDKPMIKGVRTEGGTPVDGDLDLVTLTGDITSWCYTRIEADMEALPPAAEWLCPDSGNLDQGTAVCGANQCMLQINLCVGHKFMEIADAVDVVTWTTARLGGTGPYTLPLTGSVTYDIPPQSAANRTAAYEAAVKAFGMAGERGVYAITSTTCMDTMMDYEPQTDVRQNRPELFLVGYADTVQAMVEATKKLARNQTEVAGHTLQDIRDRAAAGDAMWTARTTRCARRPHPSRR